MSSINEKEIEQFSKDSAHWWDENGPFSILHRLNPVRMEYLLEQIGDIKDKKILDVGCGGGIVCEPLARLGANITGIDADPTAIQVAQQHAEESNLDINYKNIPVEDAKEKFDVVLALEILEHVENPQNFIKDCAAHLKPSGILITSTLNRTPQSFALGIVGAEYILNVVPRGTHNWKKFIKPSELSKWIRNASLQPTNIEGLTYQPFSKTFKRSTHQIGMNYFLTAQNLTR